MDKPAARFSSRNAYELSWILLGCLTIGTVQGRSLDQIPAIDPAVTGVASGGSWRLENLRGYCRVVVRTATKDEAAASQVRLEWVVFDVDTSEFEVAKAVPIAELSDGEWSVRIEGVDESGQALRFLLAASGKGRPDSERYVLEPTGYGRYRLAEADAAAEPD